jgi:hypothetical protein
VRRRGLAAAAVLLLGLLVACSGDDGEDGAPDIDPDSTSTTALIDYSSVALGAVKGTTTTSTIALTGTSAIIGTVTGPGGAAPGATVRIERVASGSSTVIDVASGSDGRYEQRNLPGGRYRVRAFLPPALALVDPEVQFLQAGAEQTIDLAMSDQRGIRARAAVAPSTPYVDDDVNLAVAVGSMRVDADGVVRAVPVSGVRVELVGLGAWTLRRPSFDTGPGFPNRITTTTVFRSASSVAFTDGLGEAQFELVCQQPGSPGLAVNVAVMVTPAAEPGLPPPVPVQQVQTIPLDVPDCVDPFAVADTVPTTLLDE